MEYGDVVWDTQTHYLINKIENVQSEAARIVTGGTKLTSIQKLYEETGWEKLLERREEHELILPYKIVNNQAPGYLKNVLPDKSRQSTLPLHSSVCEYSRNNFKN